jgi:hypothetical protein
MLKERYGSCFAGTLRPVDQLVALGGARSLRWPKRTLESLPQLSNGIGSLLKLDDALTQLIAPKIRAVAAEK